LQTRREEFAEAKRIFAFIIDTNVFIKDPEIISKIQAKNKVIIAAKVIDELDGFKANPQLKEVASKSIREIFKTRIKTFIEQKQM
jgi:predicted ribonuclease YlaK